MNILYAKLNIIKINLRYVFLPFLMWLPDKLKKTTCVASLSFLSDHADLENSMCPGTDDCTKNQIRIFSIMAILQPK